MLLFHAVYARMYSLFLFTSALSYLALLVALERGGRRAFTLWAGAILLTVAVHPYGALVLASQALYVVLTRERLREALAAFVAVAVLGTPFWITDVRLAGRFDVGVGPGGEKLGGPLSIAGYLAHVAGDFSAGWLPSLVVTLALAATGARLLVGRNRRAALLVACVFLTPTLAFAVARLGSSAAPETRHLMFALPFFALLLAVPFDWLAARYGVGLAAGAVAAVALAHLAWAWTRTPPLFTGDRAAHVEGRRAAATWLADTSRADDVLLGYDPVFLEAWERHGDFSRLVLPRADPALMVTALGASTGALGRGIWVFDAWDTNNLVRRHRVEPRIPRPASAFEVRAFGPYLVVRTRQAVGTPRRYVERAAAAQLLGKSLDMGDADVNFDTVARAARRLDYLPARPSSRSTSSR